MGFSNTCLGKIWTNVSWVASNMDILLVISNQRSSLSIFYPIMAWKQAFFVIFNFVSSVHLCLHWIILLHPKTFTFSFTILGSYQIHNTLSLRWGSGWGQSLGGVKHLTSFHLLRRTTVQPAWEIQMVSQRPENTVTIHITMTNHDIWCHYTH